MIIQKLKTWWQSLNYYVIADPADNSITLSKRLFLHIKKKAKESDAAKVFVSGLPNKVLSALPSIRISNNRPSYVIFNITISISV